VFTDRPAFFVGDISGFAGPEDAGLLGAGVVEGEDVGVGLAGLGAPTGELGHAARFTASKRSHEQSPRELLRVAFHRFATD
jgi:hypothetical protein